MSKILNHYENNIDRAWYASSNIIYSECDDKENELKVVRITFKDGRTYEYKDVKVNDYLMFREAQSQGKAFITYIKPYECARIESLDINALQEELENLQHPEGFSVELSPSKVIIYENKEVKYTNEISAETSDILTQVLSVLGIKTKITQDDSD